MPGQPYRPRWYMIPARAFFVAFLCTLLTFAVTLFLSLAGAVVLAHTASPDLRFAYQHIALPVALVVGGIILVLSLAMEIRRYRQSKALEDIARASRGM
jgi:hypothetical protein